MAGGRRNVSRLSRPLTTAAANSDESLRARCSASQLGEGLTTRIVTPRHIPIPPIPHDSTLLFELYMFLFCVLACFLQFLHLYRSVWWLPQSYTRYSMNFYLIDPYLVCFIVTMLGRRLIYTAVNNLTARIAPPSVCPMVQKILTLVHLAAILMLLVFCAFNVLNGLQAVHILYLCYPFLVYLILFGPSITPFFDVTYTFGGRDGKSKFIIGKPVHSCSLSPQMIRQEVDSLKTDFNSRTKQALFTSLLNAYYAGFVPCCFAQLQGTLFYDVYWATQHIILVGLACFTMHSTFCYPTEYCDTLHRAALHLGRWVRVHWRSQHIPTHTWDESTLWSHGALVRHSKDLYKAEGIATAAEPGNAMHGRFYALFNNPSALVSALLGLQCCLVVIQLAALARASEWHQVVSVTLLLLANYSILFRLTRDYLVCWKVYKAEQLVQEKMAG